MAKTLIAENGKLVPLPERKPLEDWQQRVVDEKNEVSDRLSRLYSFFQSRKFAELPEAERVRMRSQARFMDGYAAVLEERIAAWSA